MNHLHHILLTLENDGRNMLFGIAGLIPSYIMNVP